MNRGMQRSGKYFSALKSMPNKTNVPRQVFSMEVDREKLESVKLKWENQRRRDRVIVIFAIVFLIVALVAVCSVVST